MAKLNLFLVRHGETTANVDHSLYSEASDHAFRLTPKGIEQAKEAGAFLATYLKKRRKKLGRKDFGNIRVWNSPYYRTRETANYILGELANVFDPSSGVLSYRENYHIFEQRVGLFDALDNDGFEEKFPEAHKECTLKQRDCGHVYQQYPMGESRIDTAIRVKPFFGTILRDAKKYNIQNAIVISHGVTVRSIVMAWKKYPPEWLNAEKNPGNAWIRVIRGNGKKGYTDVGYIFGEDAPRRDPMATQKLREGVEKIYMLRPQPPDIIVPPGIRVVDPFARHRSP